MQNKSIITYTEVQKEFQHVVKNNDESEERTVMTLLPQTDYMLGIADLTGELMRKAINSISSGDSHECFYACQVVRDLYTGYLGKCFILNIIRSTASHLFTKRNPWAGSERLTASVS